MNAHDCATSSKAKWFNTTHWTTVLAAGADWTPAAQAALERLCRSYWSPLCAYIQYRGFSREDAEDLTQQFFLSFLEHKRYRLARRERGRFRSFLLTCLKNFVISEHRRESAEKRGGGVPARSLNDDAETESQHTFELADDRTAQWFYERTWALTVLERVRNALLSEYAAAGKQERFMELEKFLAGDEGDLTYAAAATRLGLAIGTIKSDIHRLKQRYRETLREEIAHTVSTPSQIDEELRELMAVLGQSTPTVKQ